jgi:hypothetical protein
MLVKGETVLVGKGRTLQRQNVKDSKDSNVGLTLQKHPIEVSEMEEGGEDPENAGDVDENSR